MSRRVLIFGNSGSGKSTLARSLAQSEGLSHFDLDTIAWLPTNPPERSSISACANQINDFLSSNETWVIEGCYADLIEIAAGAATEMIFLNLSVEDCIANAESRPWEPHKYESKQSQDANLQMLLGWIATYPDRDDPCSLKSHSELYDGFSGAKTMITANEKSV